MVDTLPDGHFGGTLLILLTLACLKFEIKDVTTVSSDSNGDGQATDRLDLDLNGVKNLVFVHVDAFRMDHMHLYGHERPTTPEMDGWWRMDGLTSAATWTAPSTASVLTGLDPQRHGVLYTVDNWGTLNTYMGEGTFADAFRDQGYETYQAFGNEFVRPETGIGYGFSTADRVPKTYPQENLDAQIDTFAQFLNHRDPQRPFFAMLHVMDTHSPYYPTPEVAGTFITDVPFDTAAGFPDQEEQLKQQYAAGTPGLVEGVNAVYDESILGMDHAMERLRLRLASYGLTDDTVIVFTADHGEMLGENGIFGHDGGPYPELVRIPLAISFPGLTPGSSRCLAENVDTLPTVMRAMGVEVPPDLDGRALQDGCRTIARSSAFSPMGQLGQLTVENDHYRLTALCPEGNLIWDGPGGLRPDDEVGKPLYDELIAFNEDYKANVSGLTGCTIPAWKPLR